MIKKLFILFLLLCFPLTLHSGMVIGNWYSATSPSCTGFAGDYCIDLNTASEDTSHPTNWDADGVGNSYDNTSPALEGTQNLEIAPGLKQVYDPSFDETEMYVVFMFRFSQNLDNNHGIFAAVASNGSTYVHSIRLLATNYLEARARDGTANSTPTTQLVAGINYYIKVYMKETTGANDGICRVYVWTGSAWSLEGNSTDGTRTDNIDQLWFQNNDGTAIEYFDLIKKDNSDITSP